MKTFSATSGYCILTLLLSLTFWSFPFSGHVQNFPPMTIVIHDSAATQGYYFMSPYTNSPPFSYDRPHLILDRYGRVIYYRIFQGGSNINPTIDFKLQPDGRMSFFSTDSSKCYLMDSTFTVVDSLGCANGFEMDQHDFQVLPNHHYLLFGRETRIMNLTSYHWFGPNHTTPGGANAQVIGVVIQEFDENKVLVWEWRAHDHFQFGDVSQVWLSNPNKVDWTHANAVELDHDGNVLLSCRHFNEITKINHATGAIIWRLGGKQNQFTFPNDPTGFTGQHDIRRCSDTSVSFFDNGQYTNPPVARGVEYALDETNKIATLVWEYIYDSSMYSNACGNHQHIANGNHLVDFGFHTGTNPWMVVVKPDKSKILEISYPGGYISYRAFNYITLPWQLNRPAVNCRKSGANYYLEAEPGHPAYKWSTGATTSSIQITAPGEYWVFVPYGTGNICSEYVSITDLAGQCQNVDVPPAIVPAETGLEMIPNPATEKTEIVFKLPVNSTVTISLFSLLGEEVMKPARGVYPAGIHEIAMDVSSLERGIYFLSMVTGSNRIVKKLIVR
ncbi:MAG: aryl-sulfate sulfotransferase [Bacteroidota bacterium]